MNESQAVSSWERLPAPWRWASVLYLHGLTRAERRALGREQGPLQRADPDLFRAVTMLRNHSVSVEARHRRERQARVREVLRTGVGAEALGWQDYLALGSGKNASA